MKKVLVIGANSYIGQKFNEFVNNTKMHDVEVDLVSASDGAWSQVDFSVYDTVLHLSAIVHKKEKKNMKKLYNDINYNLAVEVARKAKDSQVKQFIFMSTAAVFGTMTEIVPNEAVPKPVTIYGKTKYAAEQEIINMNETCFQVAIIRPPMIYGEGCKGNFPRLVKLAKFTPVFPEFHNKRSVIHINKLSHFITQLVVNDSSGYYHPQDDKYGDTCEIIVAIRKCMGKKTVLTKIFNPIIYILKKYSSIFNKLFGDMYYKL